MDRWLTAQRLGVTASIMVTHPGLHPAFRAARKILQKDITVDRDRFRGFDYFRSLPPWVLAVLARALKQRSVPDLNRAAILAEKALRHNLIGRVDDTSTIARAQILAYHVLLADTRIDGLLRLGRTLFGHYAHRLGQDLTTIAVEEMSSCLVSIRDPLTSSQRKCQAIQKLGEILGHTQYWEQVENILYHNQFCWPLLVFDSGHTMRRYTQTLALSLPVAVDVIFDNRSRICQETGAGVLSLRWEKSLKRAVYAAKTLWRAEHEAYGTFRDLVKKASVIFDFFPAERIVETFARNLNAKISLSDRSAEAYFAQVVLGRLLGRGSVMVSAVTGIIGDQIKDENAIDQPNFQFGVPQGIIEKVQYAAATGFFERIVLPRASELKDADEDSLKKVHLSDRGETRKSPSNPQPIETLYAEDLQSVSDHVHLSGWRRHRYIRCPEVEWAIHSKGSPGLLKPSEDKRVKEIIARLASNASSMLKLDVSPAAVASAFCHIDDCLCREQPILSPPLSWAFVNFSEEKTSVRWDDEKDIFFWELLFKAMGAGSGEFLSFLGHPSRAEAVKYLTSRLNKFVPLPDHPYRCPDLLVLIRRQTLSKSTGQSRTLRAKPFMVDPILNELKNSLRPIGKRYDFVTRLLGKTRIIILPNAALGKTNEKKASLKDLSKDELRQLRLLATLEDSFTRRTASLLLSRSGDSPRQISPHEILEKFLGIGAIRYVHGKYHVPSFVARRIPADRKLKNEVKRYYAAGAALAPYVIGGQGALSMAVDVTFTPEYFEEANQHFRKALGYSKQIGSMEAGRIREASREAIGRLTRFVMAPSWANVSRLSKGANRLPGLTVLEPYEKACELLRWYDDAKIPPHPFDLLNAADSAIRAAKRIQRFVENPNTPSNFRAKCKESSLRMHVQARELCLRAQRSCSGLPKKERDHTLLFCLAKYVVNLCDRHWVLTGNEPQSNCENRETEIQRSWAEIQNLLSRKVKLSMADGLECFELMGDRESDHGKALDTYHKGLETGLFWPRLSLKTWGAASLCGQKKPLEKMLKGFPVRRRGHLIYKAFYICQLWRTNQWSHEILRIEEGARVFEDFYGNNPHIRATKAAFDRDYGKDFMHRWLENESSVVRGKVTHLKDGQQRGFIRSENGRRYLFHAFKLAKGMTFEDIYEGMEVDFEILRESTHGRVGEAVNLRQPTRLGESPEQRVKNSPLKPHGKHDRIQAGGEKHNFQASRLAGGLAYEDTYEGMSVEFQIETGLPQGNIDETISIGQIKHGKAAYMANFPGATNIGSTISEGGEAKCVRTVSDIDNGHSPKDERPRSGPDARNLVLEPLPENPANRIQKGKICLFSQFGKYGFISARGTNYYFRGSDLRGDLTYTEVYEGMEVKFKTKKEKTDFIAAGATDVRLTEDIKVWRTSANFIKGTVSFLELKKNYRFIRSSQGKSYHFSASDLRDGLTLRDIYEGMSVEFQVRNEAEGNQVPEAMNVRPIQESSGAKTQTAHQPESGSFSRGTVFSLKKDRDCGFIRSLRRREYQFHASDLSQELGYNDVYNGMEVEFQILREPASGLVGKAIPVRRVRRVRRAPQPFHKGTIYCLVPRKKCGFISSLDGTEYQFTAADLRGGLRYEDIYEGTEVIFEIRSEPDKKSGKAAHVRLYME